MTAKKAKKYYEWENDEWIANIGVILDQTDAKTKGLPPDVRVQRIVQQLETARKELLRISIDRAQLRLENMSLRQQVGIGTAPITVVKKPVLDANTCQFIRQIFWAGGVSQKEIAKQFGISCDEVNQIACGLKVDTC